MPHIHEPLFKRIDKMIATIERFKNETTFNPVRNERSLRKIKDKWKAPDMLRTYAHMVAFSKGAPSDKVRDELIKTGIFEKIFHQFEVEKVAKMSPSVVMKKHWTTPLTYIRFREKITAIIGFARQLQKDSSLTKLIRPNTVTPTIKSQRDIKQFWMHFDQLRLAFEERQTPYLKSFTSLLHYLLEMGFDTIKPDSAVMAVCLKLKIVENVIGTKNLRQAVDTLMQYSVSRKIRPGLVDLYFLIEKPQKGARNYVHPNFFLQSRRR